MTMNKKAREEWDKKQAEAERLRRLNEVSAPAHIIKYKIYLLYINFFVSVMIFTIQPPMQPEGSNGVDGEKDKDEGRAKSIKVSTIIHYANHQLKPISQLFMLLCAIVQANKEEDDKMRTTAANVAARAAVGGDDMLSKWQLMAEQARQKREGGTDASGSQPGKDVSRKPLSTSGRKENQDAEKRGNTASISAFGKYALN